jgi:hypothetical protein
MLNQAADAPFGFDLRVLFSRLPLPASSGSLSSLGNLRTVGGNDGFNPAPNQVELFVRGDPSRDPVCMDPGR